MCVHPAGSAAALQWLSTAAWDRTAGRFSRIARSAGHRRDRIALETAEGAGRLEVCADIGRAARFAEAETLHEMHAGGAQEQVLLGVLDAFRRHLHAQSAP